jgi:hypothetical protein
MLQVNQSLSQKSSWVDEIKQLAIFHENQLYNEAQSLEEYLCLDTLPQRLVKLSECRITALYLISLACSKN